MPTMVIELPAQKALTAFNLRRWSELLEDPELAKVEGRIETDRYGNIIMSPPPAASHGGYQAQITFLLQTLRSKGRVLTECPISTADGVKAADVAWASPESLRELGNRACFPRCPELCVEVLSPRNREAEINEKKRLYFDAGAQEVWTCDKSGRIKFFLAGSETPVPASNLFRPFPKRIRLR
jgi:Uma2 family endonuclease